MYKVISNTITKKWINKGIIEQEDHEIYAYGIEIILSSIFGAMLVIVAGLVFSSLLHALIFLTILIPLRCYCGGYHANSYVKCNLSMVILFVFIAYVSKEFAPNCISLLIGLLICCGIVFLFAPVDNKNKVLSQSEKKKHAIISRIICLGISILDIFTYMIEFQFYSITFYSLLLVSILLVVGKIKNRVSQ